MSEIESLQAAIRDEFGADGARMMDILDGMRRNFRLPLLRKLIALETASLQQQIEDLRSLLPLEDRP